MTKNEYIASIMLEAADLLKEDNQQESLNEDINTINLMYQNVYLANKLCESIDHLIDRYENDFYILSEGVGSTIWEGIKKICKAIRDAWKWFIGLFTKNKQKKAKKDAEVVDPNKAKKVVDEVVDAYSKGEEIPKVDIDDIKKDIKEGQTLDNYGPLETKIESAVSKIEKETDEEKVKKANEALKIINKITTETAKVAQLCLPESKYEDPEKRLYYYDDKGKLVRENYHRDINEKFNFESDSDYYYKDESVYKNVYTARHPNGRYKSHTHYYNK